METSIQLTLISGFLGAGKTTFLKKYLEHAKGRKIGILVNEFGIIGMDGPILNRGGIEMVELSQGSIFCACLKKDFVQALKEFSALPIEELVIENSGMADPGSMQQILDSLSQYLTRPYHYRGLVCLVDSLTFLDYLDGLLPLQRQIQAADFVLINKTDLASTAEIQDIHEAIAAYNPKAICYNTLHAEVPFDYLEGNLSRRGMDTCPCCACSNTPETRPANYVLEAIGVYNIADLQQFCTVLAPYTLRMKGFMRSAEGLLQIDTVGTQVDVALAQGDDLDELPQGKLVIIGKDATPFDDSIQQAWATCLHDTCTLLS